MFFLEIWSFCVLVCWLCEGKKEKMSSFLQWPDLNQGWHVLIYNHLIWITYPKMECVKIFSTRGGGKLVETIPIARPYCIWKIGNGPNVCVQSLESVKISDEKTVNHVRLFVVSTETFQVLFNYKHNLVHDQFFVFTQIGLSVPISKYIDVDPVTRNIWILEESIPFMTLWDHNLLCVKQTLHLYSESIHDVRVWGKDSLIVTGRKFVLLVSQETGKITRHLWKCDDQVVDTLKTVSCRCADLDPKGQVLVIVTADRIIVKFIDSWKTFLVGQLQPQSPICVATKRPLLEFQLFTLVLKYSGEKILNPRKHKRSTSSSPSLLILPTSSSSIRSQPANNVNNNTNQTITRPTTRTN